MGDAVDWEHVKTRWLETDPTPITQDALLKSVDCASKILSRVFHCSIPERSRLTRFRSRELVRTLLQDENVVARVPNQIARAHHQGFVPELERRIRGFRRLGTNASERSVAQAKVGRADPELEYMSALFEATLEALSLWDDERIFVRAFTELAAMNLTQVIDPQAVFGSPHAFFWNPLPATGPRSGPAGGIEASFIELCSLRGFVSFLENPATAHGPLHTLAPTPAFTPTPISDSDERDGQPSAVELWRTHTVWCLADDLSATLTESDRGSRHGSDVGKDRLVVLPSDMKTSEIVKDALAKAMRTRSDRPAAVVRGTLGPLELVHRRFDPKDLREILPVLERDRSLLRAVTERLAERGFRGGWTDLNALLERGVGRESTKLSWLPEVKRWSEKLKGRFQIAELRARHFSILSTLTPRDQPWLSDESLRTLARIYDELATDEREFGLTSQDGSGTGRATLAFWLLRLRERIAEVRPLSNQERSDPSVSFVPIGKAGLSSAVSGRRYDEVHIVCPDPASRSDLEWVRYWRSEADRLVIWESSFGASGSERVSMQAALAGEVRVTERGARPRWTAGFSEPERAPPMQVSLEWGGGRTGSLLFGATEIDRVSRCSFQGLAISRWRLRDGDDAGVEPWPWSRGLILHKAVELMLRPPQGSVTPREALEQAWKLSPPRGWFGGLKGDPSMEAPLKRQYQSVLERFLEQERLYQEASGNTVFEIEDPDLLKLSFGETTVEGRPDRLDVTKEGEIFVIDYKTGTDHPRGREMVETGRGLQLPFYALAAQKKFSRACAGGLFVELTRKADRNKGLIFKSRNGKGPGKITALRSNNASLLEGSPSDIWDILTEHLRTTVTTYGRGDVLVKPKLATECRTCQACDLCGIRRYRKS